MKRKAALLLLILLAVFAFSACKKELPEGTDAVSDNVLQSSSENTAEGQNSKTEESQDSTAEGNQNSAAEEIQDLVPEEGAELTFWTSDTDFAKAAAARFQELYGVTVNVEEAGLNNLEKIMLDGPAGNGADLFMVAHDSFQTGYSAGVFLELDSQVASKMSEELNPVAVKTVTRDGKMYGIPLSIESDALFYNKDLVQGEPAATMEQIISEAKEKNNPDENIFWFLYKLNDGYSSFPFLTAYGWQLFGANGDVDDNPGFNTAEYEKGLEVIASFKDIIPINSGDLKMDASNFLVQNLIDGKTAYYLSGPYNIKTFKDAGVNFGITTLPTYNGKELTPFGGVQNIHISAYTKYPAAAQLFAEFLVSEEGAGLLYEKASKITARSDVSNVNGLKDDEEMKIFVEQFNNAVPMPSAKRISYYWSISENILGSVFDGELTPEEGAEKAQTDFDALVASE